MNIILRTKIETCLELATSAADFKKKVLQVTGLSSDRFDEFPITKVSYDRLSKGEKANDIINALF